MYQIDSSCLNHCTCPKEARQSLCSRAGLVAAAAVGHLFSMKSHKLKQIANFSYSFGKAKNLEKLT